MSDHLSRTTELLEQMIAYPTISDQSNLDMIAALADLLDAAGRAGRSLP